MFELSNGYMPLKTLPPNGLRYPLVGGTRQRRFDGTHYKPQKLSENAQTPTSRVHAVLGAGTPSNLNYKWGISSEKINNGIYICKYKS